jgi:glycosyltransferase involved in cell wall biosynthesis
VKLSIVIPAYNEERLLGATLASIRAAAPAGSEVIVCDNNSTDLTAEVAREAGAKVVFEPHNQISRARNRGASVATGDWLVFVDADSTVSRGLFQDLAAAVAGGEVLAGGSTIVADSSSAGYRFSIRAWNLISRMTRWAAGSFIFVERKTFEAMGGFSTELYASEELDLFARLKKQARAKDKRIVILHQHPIRTSDRKVHLYGWKTLFKAAGRFILSPRKGLRSREACHPWYDGRR